MKAYANYKAVFAMVLMVYSIEPATMEEGVSDRSKEHPFNITILVGLVGEKILERHKRTNKKLRKGAIAAGNAPNYLY